MYLHGLCHLDHQVKHSTSYIINDNACNLWSKKCYFYIFFIVIQVQHVQHWLITGQHGQVISIPMDTYRYTHWFISNLFYLPTTPYYGPLLSLDCHVYPLFPVSSRIGYLPACYSSIMWLTANYATSTLSTELQFQWAQLATCYQLLCLRISGSIFFCQWCFPSTTLTQVFTVQVLHILHPWLPALQCLTLLASSFFP